MTTDKPAGEMPDEVWLLWHEDCGLTMSETDYDPDCVKYVRADKPDAMQNVEYQDGSPSREWEDAPDISNSGRGIYSADAAGAKEAAQAITKYEGMTFNDEEKSLRDLGWLLQPHLQFIKRILQREAGQ